MTVTRKGLIIICVISIALMAIGFGVARIFSRSEQEIKKDFELPYKHREDSIVYCVKVKDRFIDSVLSRNKRIDKQMELIKKTNPKKYVEINNFTPTARERYLDSLERTTIPQ